MRKQIATSLEEDIIKRAKFMALEKDINLNEHIENALKLYDEYYYVFKFLEREAKFEKDTESDLAFGMRQLLQTGIK